MRREAAKALTAPLWSRRQAPDPVGHCAQDSGKPDDDEASGFDADTAHRCCTTPLSSLVSTFTTLPSGTPGGMDEKPSRPCQPTRSARCDCPCVLVRYRLNRPSRTSTESPESRGAATTTINPTRRSTSTRRVREHPQRGRPRCRGTSAGRSRARRPAQDGCRLPRRRHDRQPQERHHCPGRIPLEPPAALRERRL